MRAIIKERIIKMLSSVRGKMLILLIVTTLLTSLTSVFVLRTSDNLITKMDQLFRYNVKSLDRVVKISEELEMAKAYYYKRWILYC